MSRNAAPPSSRCSAWERRPFTDPIEIPGVRADDSEEEEGLRDDDGEVVVPPHVLLARRRAAFSMCSGQGRTLKGRDQRRVRDSVLRMTGFIES
jgi:hypothetical protein